MSETPWADSPIHKQIRDAGVDDGSSLAASTCSLPSFVETAFVFAARYVHHRDTGGTLAVCRALAYMWPELSEHAKEQILRESHEATTNLREWAEFRGDEPENEERTPTR